MANLWIRSQDKRRLIKVKDIWEVENSVLSNNGNKGAILGTYKSKERCIEIIDEIQKFLQSNGLIIMKDTDVSELSPKDFIPFKVIAFDSTLTPKIPETIFYNLQDLVYEMPEE